LWCQRCGSLNTIHYGVRWRITLDIWLIRLFCKDCRSHTTWWPPFLLPGKHSTVYEFLGPAEAYIRGIEGYLKTWLREEVAGDMKTFFYRVKALAESAGGAYRGAVATLAKHKPFFAFEKDSRFQKASFHPAHTQEKQKNLLCLYKLFILREYYSSFVPADVFFPWIIFRFSQGTPNRFLPTRFWKDPDP